MRNIALVGYMRSGKTSVADCLCYLFDNTFQLSFARALKLEVSNALNCVRVEGDPLFSPEYIDEEENKKVFRTILQWWGTEFRRNKNEYHWVDKVTAQLNAASPKLNWVCTDARYTNELEMLKKRGFQIIHLDMDVDELMLYQTGKGMTRQQISEQLEHASEREWQGYPKDISLKSSFGNLPELTAQVVAFITGAIPTREEKKSIEEFYARKYPSIYGKGV